MVVNSSVCGKPAHNREGKKPSNEDTAGDSIYMSKTSLFRYFVLLAAVVFLLAACRRGEDSTPEVVEAEPTVESVEESAEEAETVEEAEPTAEPEPTATLEPQPLVVDWPPQIVVSDPTSGEEMPLDGIFTIRFDQPMDQGSVEAAWDIEPAVEGRFEWPRPDTVLFTPQKQLQRSAQYRVRIEDSATAETGLNLEEPFEFMSTTVGDLAVTQYIPDDGTQNVQTDGAITVVFNRPVVPLTSSGQQAGLPQPLMLDPAVEGEGTWVSTSIYRFEPGPDGFAGGTSYRATVEAGLTDVTGAELPASVSWQFTTQNPDVLMVSPPNNASLVAPTRPISITFNMPMDRASAESAVSLNPGAALNFEWQEDDRLLVATPQEGLELETEYELTIGQSALSASGGAGLEKTASSSFTTVPFPAVKQTYPSNGEVASPWQRGVSIDFVSSMDFETLEDKITIIPEPEEVTYYYNEWIDEFDPTYSSFNLNLDFELQKNTEYIITIPASAADPYGNTLGEDFILRFESPGFSPVASFNLPTPLSQISTSFPSDVEVIHRNISQFEVGLYQPDSPLTRLDMFYPWSEEVPLGEPLRTWTVPVDTPQDEVGIATVSLADGAALPNGVYVLTITAPEINPDYRYWQNQRHVLVVADTNIVISEMPDEVHVWVTDLESGQPAAGRPVSLSDIKGNPLDNAVTDSNGFAAFDYEPIQEFERGVLAISGEPGQPEFGVAASNWIGETNIWNLGINYGWGPALPLFSYLYTDRPIYRPGDTVYFKGILRENNYGRYALPPEQSLDLQITTFSYYSPDSGLDETITVDVNAEGLFWGEFVLPEDAPLGSYNISTQNPELDLVRSFTVAEYRKPEFQVTITPEIQEKLRGEPAEVMVEATYFFGGSASGLEVQWIVYEESYNPSVPGPYYAFSDQADFNYINYGPFGGPFGGIYGAEVANGSGTTDENGKLTIPLPADLLDEVEEGSRKVTVEARVIDITEFPVTATSAVIFHAADGYVGVRPADFAPAAGTETAVNLLTVDWEGEPLGNQNVEVVFYQREWERIRNDDFGQYMTEWEAVDTEVARTSITTGTDGKGQATFVPDEGGNYIAVATLTDSAGRQQSSSAYLWVVDDDFAGWRTDPKQRTMDLEADKADYLAGETARILVKSPFTGPVKAWLLIERGNLVEQQVITLDGGSTVIDLPVKAEYAPNVFVSVVAVKPVTRDDVENPFADIRLGIVEVPVAPDQFDLQVTLTPQELFFEPGETAVYDVLVTDKGGSPVSADFSLAMVDLAVLTLKEDNAPPILEAFYSPQLYRSQVGSGLFISGEGLEVEVPLEGGGFGGGGGGDMAEAAVGKLDEEGEDETRREFPDTAYWEASVQTDADGKATVEIPLPDSLTTWRLSSKAVTEDTQVGQGEADVIVSLPLLIRPITPRFFTVGDVVQLGAVVNNNTDSAVEAAVSLEAMGLTLSGDAEQVVTIPTGGSERVRWELTVEDVPFADLTFRVQGGDYVDATKPTLGVGPDNMIPVYRYDAQDFTGTAGELDEAGRLVEAVLLPPNVDPLRGSVDIKFNASLAAALLEALEVLEKHEVVPACPSDATNRLLANVATDQAIKQLDLERPDLTAPLAQIIPQDIATLEEKQMRGGGWGWCYSNDADPWLSAYALLVLSKARDNDYPVDSSVIDRGESYLQRQLEDMEDIADRWEANRQAFFLYVLAEAGENVIEEVDALVDDHRGLLDPYAKALLIMAYDTLAAGEDKQETLLADINDQAVVSAGGAHWEDAEQDFLNLSSDIRGTAIVINALSQVQPDSPLAAPAVRWLMLARTAEIWPTTHETAWSIFGLSEWMAASGELEANYDYQLNVNGIPFANGTFNSDNVATTDALEVPVSNLEVEETNFFDFQRGEGDGKLYYTMYLNSFISADTVEATSRGVTVERAYFDAACDPQEETCEPITEIEAGQQVRVELAVVVPNDLIYAVVEDPLPAGAEGIDPNLDINSADLAGGIVREDEPTLYGYWGWWYFNNIEYRDEKVVFLASFLPAGTYTYTYNLQTIIPGEYQVMPAVGYQEFFPDVFGRSDGMLFTITGE
jgi:alpha-2-macroglobulin